MDEEISTITNKIVKKTESEYFNEPLNQNQKRYLVLFFLVPITFIVLGFVIIMVAIILAISINDYTGLWSYIWFNIQLWASNALISLAIGISCAIIFEFIPRKHKKSKVIGQIRRFLRNKQFFPILYIIPILAIAFIVVPIDILALYYMKIFTFFKIQPFISIPIIAAYVIYYVQLLISPPYDTVGDLIDEGNKIYCLLEEVKPNKSRGEEKAEENNFTSLFLWQKTDSFFLKLNDYLEDRIDTRIHNVFNVTADIMMVWVSGQATNLRYILKRIEKIITAVKDKEIVILIEQLEELITKSKTATMKFEGVLDYKIPLEKTIKKTISQRKWYQVLQFMVYILIPLTYFVIKLVELL